MFFKICGVLVLGAMTYYLCHSLTRFESRRIRQTEGFLLLLRHIKAMISCYRAPVREIYDGFSCRALEECGFIDALRLEGSFERAIQICRERIYLEEEEINLLTAFGRELGKSYRDEEVESCDYYIGEFERAFAGRREEHPKRVKLYRSLVITGALMLVIVLI